MKSDFLESRGGFLLWLVLCCIGTTYCSSCTPKRPQLSTQLSTRYHTLNDTLSAKVNVRTTHKGDLVYKDSSVYYMDQTLYRSVNGRVTINKMR